MSNIKYIGNGEDTGKVHIKKSNSETACGKRIDDNPQDWVNTNEAVTCQKNGCSNN